MSATHLSDLASAILDNATKLDNYFNQSGIDPPSFEEHAAAELSLSPEMQQARQQATDAAIELQDLLMGPAMLLRPVLNGTSLQAIYKYNIAAHVPLNGSISYRDLSKAVKLREIDLKRVVRFASMYHRVFQEKKYEQVSHTAASRLLAESPDAMANVGLMFEEMYQAYAHTVESLGEEANPRSTHTGWTIANKTDTPIFEYYANLPQRAERFARAMSMLTKGGQFDLTEVVNGYDWLPIDAHKGLIVDLGGSRGTLAMALTREYSGLRCTVQDLPNALVNAQDQVPRDVADRVSFVPHNFFDEQRTTADAYLFRQVLHNWSDEDSVQILRALIPALRPGAKIIVNDTIVPPPGVLPPMQERAIRSMDMIMMSVFNSRERETGDWEQLFKSADSRFGDVKCWMPENSQLGLIEATWKE
ncbi:MAG: hypothetical protein M1828_006403 [Chrysothrix sp. TS-e1954]|nr:MAG: hypothetical protein M1828_006403 [Chrysothrix sp. TS-e1954]